MTVPLSLTQYQVCGGTNQDGFRPHVGRLIMLELVHLCNDILA